MLHWIPGRAAPPVITSMAELMGHPRGTGTAGSARSDHARMLAHAAKRRLAASGEDAAYWKACAPAAIAKASAIRAAGLVRLP